MILRICSAMIRPFFPSRRCTTGNRIGWVLSRRSHWWKRRRESSALVNAIAGQNITPSSSHGRGTEAAIAYVHTDHAQGVRCFWNARRPVVIASSLIRSPACETRRCSTCRTLTAITAITFSSRKLCCVTCFIRSGASSIEKYADRQAQQMLLRVAAGNATGNFLFVLNKEDRGA